MLLRLLLILSLLTTGFACATEPSAPPEPTVAGRQVATLVLDKVP